MEAFRSGLSGPQKPRIIDDDIVLLADGGGMFCLSLTNGTRRWWAPNVVEFLAATKDSVYTSDALGNVVLLERQTGAFKGALPLRRFAVRLGNDRTDRLYVSTESGLVVCLREIGKEFPVYHMFPDRLPIVPELAPEGDASQQNGPLPNQN